MGQKIRQQQAQESSTSPIPTHPTIGSSSGFHHRPPNTRGILFILFTFLENHILSLKDHHIISSFSDNNDTTAPMNLSETFTHAHSIPIFNTTKHKYTKLITTKDAQLVAILTATNSPSITTDPWQVYISQGECNSTSALNNW